MTFRVYYLSPLKFVQALFLKAENVEPKDYKEVAFVECESLGDLFRYMNCVDGSPEEFVGPGDSKLNIRSLSVGDVAVDGDGKGWLCQAVGWGEVPAEIIERFPEEANANLEVYPVQ